MIDSQIIVIIKLLIKNLFVSNNSFFRRKLYDEARI